MVNIIGILLLAYFIGNISPSYLCGRVFGKLDIREHGSGNAGTTNVIRVMGWRFGAIVFVLDIIKGMLAVWLGFLLGDHVGGLVAGFFVVIGHDFPVLLSFRGGKGIAASAGIFLFLFPGITLIGVVFFVTVVLITKMVSVGSLAFVTIMAAFSFLSKQPQSIVLLTSALAVFAYFRHWENIQRIFQGTENKIFLKTRKAEE